MKYEINFDNNAVERMFMELGHSFDWSESCFEIKDLERNVRSSACFVCALNTLKMFDAETDCGTYNDDGYTRIGYAKINNFEFVKNAKFNSKKLYDALWEIAHKDEKNK